MCLHAALSEGDAVRRNVINAFCGIVLGCSLLKVAGCCPFTGLAYEDDLVSDYAVWAVDSLSDAAIVRKVSRHGATSVVEPMVFAYGYNDDFIIAKRHPVDDKRTVDMRVTQWFIVQVRTGSVHGPLTQEEYDRMRTKIGVPLDVTFSRMVTGK